MNARGERSQTSARDLCRRIELPGAQRPCFHRGVIGSRPFVRYWLPVILWMVVIFCFSADRGSEERTSRFLAPMLRWLKPDISDASLHQIQFVVRKCGHLAEYAILSAFVWRAVRPAPTAAANAWSWKATGRTLLVIVLYAASDEFHQAFVPARDASLRDVSIDTLGGGIGLALIWANGRWRRRW